jgi:Zn-dependent protease with chaperone function
MARAAGKLNYVNPFDWFLFWYYRSYSLLAAGFSRSREFLADRMAVSVYGKDAFSSGLTKVAADGTLFENTAFAEASRLLSQDKAFVNVYDVFQEYHDGEAGAGARKKLYDELLDEKRSLFASHPTFRERIEVVLPFPDAPQQETEPALGLFEDPGQIEKELTEFLTGYVAFLRRAEAQAAAAS